MAGPHNRSVLHIDDDPGILRLFHHQLTKLGYDVTSLDDPSLALTELLKNGYGVVLLDINMPQVNGVDLLRQIKRQDGGTQVIMLTGLVSMSTTLQSMRWGAEACLFKPMEDITPLADAIDGAFAKIERWWETLRDLTNRKRHGVDTDGMPSEAALTTEPEPSLQ